MRYPDYADDTVGEIMTAPDEGAARTALLRSFCEYQSPTCVLLRSGLPDEHDRQGLELVWVDMRHVGQNYDPAFRPESFVNFKLQTMPEGLTRWVSQRWQPVRFTTLQPLFPEAVHGVFRDGDIYNLPPLEEVIVLPHWHAQGCVLLVVPLCSVPDLIGVSRICCLGGIYLNRWHRVLARQPVDMARHDDRQLSVREIECLRWAAAGKTLHDIATLTGYSYRTVRRTFDKARERYGYATFHQTLTRAAIDYGFDPLGRDLS